MDTLLLDNPHQRYNPLTGQWLLLSPQRAKRPWQGNKEPVAESALDAYDDSCYLCPGNLRANNIKNPDYSGVFVFDNDFPALLNQNELTSDDYSELFEARPVNGTCKVICFSDRHDLTLAQMDTQQIQAVVSAWMEQTEELAQTYQWVQLFENKGAIMGCSNPHPHGQIWAGDYLPDEPLKEDRFQKAYYQKHSSPMLIDYLENELAFKDRIVCENSEWVCLVPYWAVWPFETLILPKKKTQQIKQLSQNQQETLSHIMKSILVKYDNIFQTSFAYSMGWHGAPFSNQDCEHWQLHAHYYPPLLRSATIKKFMVGYEMLGCAQRDITPETAAQIIRNQAETHYTLQEV